MRSRINRLSPLLSTKQLLLTVGALLVSALPVAALPAGRVVVREDIKGAHRADLLEKLRLISGLRLSLDRTGALVLGQVEGPGSVSARELLTRAVHGDKAIVIEEASNRAGTAFCNLLIRQSGDALGEFLYIVQIDFEDFRNVIGNGRARASFNAGWGLLHELDHVVSESEDTGVASEAGECEENINQMRVELGLPVRATYRFSPMPAPADPAFITRLVRLGFVETDARSNRTKQYWLVWDVSLVGGTNSRREVALSSMSVR